MAEAIFNHKIEQMSLSDRYMSDSAGTAGYHIGEQPDPRTVETVQKNGIKIHHSGQQFIKRHGQEYDHIIAMDSSNLRNILNELDSTNERKVRLMRDWDPKGEGDVPDPYYGGSSGFDNVFAILDRSIEELIVDLKSE